MERAIYQFDNLPVGPADAAGEERVRATGDQRVGVILNTRSHRNQDREPDLGGHGGVTLARPQTRRDIAHALADFARQPIDLLVISGGDGTVRDVLTMGQTVFQDGWPAIAILPRGKTNALNVDLGSPRDWTLAQAIAEFRNPQGRRVTRRPLAVQAVSSREPPMLGFILGAGAFALGVEAGQGAHKAGFFNSLAVGVTSLWGVIEALLGSDTNRWRRGAAMELRDLDSAVPFPRSRHGHAPRRTLLLASTLQTMPMHIQLFGKQDGAIRIVLLDHARRRVLALAPAILAGWHPRWLAKAGLHHLVSDGFALTIEEPFILDGEHFPAGAYRVQQGPELTFVAGR